MNAIKEKITLVWVNSVLVSEYVKGLRLLVEKTRNTSKSPSLITQSDQLSELRPEKGCFGWMNGFEKLNLGYLS